MQVEKISDKELEHRKKELKRPFNIINTPLYRIYLFETPTAKYVYADFYHVIIDGVAVVMLFYNEINSRYNGKKITRTAILSFRSKISRKNIFWTANTKNISFFFAASMLAIAKSAGSKSAIMDWIHNGRYNSNERRLMGPMIEQFPIDCEFKDDMSLEELFDSLQEKMNLDLKYRKSLGAAYQHDDMAVCSTYVFHKKIHSALTKIKLGGHPAEKIELPINKWSATENILNLEFNLSDEGTYYVEYSYDAGIYSENAIKNFAATLDDVVLKIQNEKTFMADILNNI